jgi:PiT family inorganic phosphate transporter
MGLSPVLVSLVIASFLMSFSIGANDAANALATSYGTNAIKLTQLLILGAVFEFIGASVFSSKVASTLADQFIINLSSAQAKT